jgi:hypothetical protein
MLSDTEMKPCAECSKKLNACLVHTGEPGESAFATTSDEYEQARKFFEVCAMTEIEAVEFGRKAGQAINNSPPDKAEYLRQRDLFDAVVRNDPNREQLQKLRNAAYVKAREEYSDAL